MLKLMTSNEGKLREYRRFGMEDLDILKGVDLPEVDADPITVILHKSLAAGANTMVEDTSLHVEGAEVGVNVRWLMDNLPTYNGNKATWEVLIGVNTGEEILVYRGVVDGVITDRFSDPVGFGFDCRFIPNGETLTLYELDEAGRKDDFSARKAVVEQWQAGNAEVSVKISEIQEWEGAYQH